MKFCPTCSQDNEKSIDDKSERLRVYYSLTPYQNSHSTLHIRLEPINKDDLPSIVVKEEDGQVVMKSAEEVEDKGKEKKKEVRAKALGIKILPLDDIFGIGQHPLVIVVIIATIISSFVIGKEIFLLLRKSWC